MLIEIDEAGLAGEIDALERDGRRLSAARDESARLYASQRERVASLMRTLNGYAATLRRRQDDLDAHYRRLFVMRRMAGHDQT